MDSNFYASHLHSYSTGVYNGHNMVPNSSGFPVQQSSSVSPPLPPVARLSKPTKATQPKTAKNGKRKVAGEAKKGRVYTSNYQQNLGGGGGRAGPQQLPVQVQRRNERERNRVRQLNSGFSTLRQHVPNGTKNKKMSKVETLHSALQYILHMQSILAASSAGNESPEVPTASSSMRNYSSLASCSGSDDTESPLTSDSMDNGQMNYEQACFAAGAMMGDFADFSAGAFAAMENNGLLLDGSSSGYVKTEEEQFGQFY